MRVVPAELCGRVRSSDFPSFSEGLSLRVVPAELYGRVRSSDFPSFSEGLSLRGVASARAHISAGISLPFRRDFH